MRSSRSWLTGPWPHAGVALVMTGAALFETGYGGRGAAFTALGVAGSVALGAAVLLARWSPLGGVLLLAASVGVPGLLLDELPPTGGAQLIASMLLVGYAAYRLRPRSGVLAYAVSAVVPAVTIVMAGESVWELAFYALILGPAWVVGRLLQREQQRSAELTRLTEALRAERELRTRVAVAAERTRISRELHDAVAHTASVMTLQVGVVRRRLGTGTVEEETLAGAEGLGRQAVDELRRIVGIVREGESPALAPLPSLAHLDELVMQVRVAGTEVVFERRGDLGRVDQAVDMSAYRIVQEGLTNALRHAPGAAVEMLLDGGPSCLVVEVVNGPAARGSVPAPDDSAAAGPAVAGRAVGGNGLTGVRERVQVLGGSVSAAPRADGGFRLRAELPLRPAPVAARVAPPAVTDPAESGPVGAP